ncbi:MAG: glycosyl hydrolase family 65 protein [Fimbriimonadaceae bacterium]
MPEFKLENGWVVVEEGDHPGEEMSRATVFAVANGLLGLRGAPEERSAREPAVKGFYRNGLYDTPAGKLTEREIVGLPDPTAVRLTIDGRPFDLGTGRVLEARRELDMADGAMRRTVRWEAPNGCVVKLVTERFLPIDCPREACLSVCVETDRPADVELRLGVEGRVWNRWADHGKSIACQAEPGRLRVELETFEPGHRIAVCASHEVTGGGSRRAVVEGESAWDILTLRLEPGQSLRVDRRVVVALPGESEEPTPGDRFPSHRARWRELWESAGIEIEGDDQALFGIRFCLFHLLATAPWHSDRISVSARGLQGQDYYGSIFWDCEIFVLPYLIATCPAAARNALGYRIHTLDGARRKARRFGWKGAFYAWQSQETGDEQCDLYVFTDPRTGEKIRSYFADEQIHISADIAYAFRQYVEATGDTAIWAAGGIDVVVEIARFFVSRTTERDGRGHLPSVLGPDEYHERVDDNAYTNAMARESLRIALETLDWMRGSSPEAFAEAAARLELADDEIERFRDLMDRLVVPGPDPESGLIEQFAGYFELRDEPIPQTRARLAHPDLHPGGPNGPFQETQNIKQADVAMLLYLMRDRYTDAVKAANFDYYEPRTSHDSSLSPMAYALVAADLGRLDYAYRYFLQTALIDLEAYGPHWNHGVHTAALGGAWQAVVHGFLHLRLRSEGVVFGKKPKLPENWSRLRVALVWHGRPFAVGVESGVVSLESRSDQPIPVVLADGRRVELAPHTVWRWADSGG